jgi:RNA recognition motif-containing protein
VTETDLRAFFGRFGNVQEVVIMYDQEKKKSRGFGFLSFDEDAAIDRVTSEHYVLLNGKQVEVKKAEPRESISVAPNAHHVANHHINNNNSNNTNLNSFSNSTSSSNNHHMNSNNNIQGNKKMEHHQQKNLNWAMPPPQIQQGGNGPQQQQQQQQMTTNHHQQAPYSQQMPPNGQQMPPQTMNSNPLMAALGMQPPNMMQNYQTGGGNNSGWGTSPTGIVRHLLQFF